MQNLKRTLKLAWRHLPFKLPVLRIVRASTKLPERVYRHLHFHGDYDVIVQPGARFRIRSYANWIENDLFWAGYAGNYEKISLGLWRELCGESETILDVGANTGLYALAAAALNPDARVVAFEPAPHVYERLMVNVALNGFRVTVENIAVSDRDGIAALYDTYNEHTYTASLNYQMLGSIYSKTYEVPTVSLDSYCLDRGIEAVDLVKIDVERHEPEVLRGFRRVLEESRPTVLLEILDREIGEAVAQQISGLGYHGYEIREEGIEDGIFAATSLGQADRNYLLCQSETAKRLRLPNPVLIY